MELTTAWILFVISTVVTAYVGTKLTREADKLADITGLGEALVGAILVGGITSLSGIVTSVTAALESHPQLSLSNAIGGIAAQTSFLAIADITYRKANLEHAAASISNIMQALLLIVILTLILTFHSLPSFTLFQIHPISLIIIIVYFLGQKMISKSQEKPMWKAVKTNQTQLDIPNEEHLKKSTLGSVITQFIVFGAIIAVAGYVLAQTAIVIAENTSLSEGIVGSLFTAVASSLPELIVSVSAVRQGALTLAISNVIGGNVFDVLFISFSDIAYREGSIIHAMGTTQNFTLLLTLLLTTVLTLGLLYREKDGFGKIGWESITILLLFIAGNAVLFFL